ncbi:MAG: PIG-L family deacetylase [Clostridiales bacterium]|nr:PIG-L family deacetylase [Clostridiales bacterium]
MKIHRMLWLILLLALLPAAALGTTAEDISESCDFMPSKPPVGRVYYMLDDDYTTFWYVENPDGVSIDVSAPEGQEMGGVYIKWYREIPSWRIDVPDGDGWLTVAQKKDGYVVEYVALPAGTRSFRLCRAEDDTSIFKIGEMRVYGPGEPPEDVQRWEPVAEKCDILVFSTHPDDEVLYMGGTIPYYVARGKTVQVVYMTTVTSYRKIELHDCLWACGVRNYPVLGPLTDKNLDDIQLLYERYWPLEKVQSFIVECIRRCKPEVVVTHDLGGEYGHLEHVATARNTVWAITRTADETCFPESAGQYGAWQVKKLYLHLYQENEIVMNWSQPLDFFGGETALSMAAKGFELHRSQSENNYHSVKNYGLYDCRLFGLYYTEVGEDILKNDFLENIP